MTARTPERFDAIVVGAGPAGSTSAALLARSGLSVLLLDRARFPRDKPCGGGITGRAAQLLPFPVDPVVEHTVDRLELAASYRGRFERRSKEPLVLMTQRSRLDAYLAERAVDAGVTFRDGIKVTAVEGDGEAAVVTAGRWRGESAVVIGADGANGVSARSLGLAPRTYCVALEGNLAHGAADAERYRGRAVIELGVVPGGYAWVFPKGNHVNVGVAGWEAEGPRLREHLRRLLEQHRLPPALEAVRGFRLPLRRAGASLARGRALLVGDAAGLIDPLSGDGIYEALASARLAVDRACDLVAGRASSLRPYELSLVRELGPLCAASWGWKLAFDRFPRLAASVIRTPLAWRVVEDLLRGDLSDPRRTGGARAIPLRLLEVLARFAGDPGRSYREELARA
jgi:geranylgeranyl reductase family protein